MVTLPLPPPRSKASLCSLRCISALGVSPPLSHSGLVLLFLGFPDTVICASKGVSSVDAWYATTLDIEEVLCNGTEGHVHIFVADVIKSFDTVDRGILDCALGRLGLPGWLRRVYFAYHAQVLLHFMLAAGAGEAWTRDGGIPQGSVDAWYSTALDLEESLSGALDSDVHIFVADVVKSFDTVDRGFLDYVLSRLWLHAWFRHAYFEYHAKVRLRFKLSCGVGQAWTRDGGIPQGCPLSMIFIVALLPPLV